MSEGNRTDDIQGPIVHEYDGIEEADNALPGWWLWIFYLSVAFAVAYWFYFEGFGAGLSPRAAYDLEAAAIAAATPVVTEEELLALAADEAEAAAGAELFGVYCVPCHDAQGQGKVGLGPNLTDRFWIHGGAPLDIHRTVSEGVPGTAMMSWRSPLGPESVRRAVVHVMSLRNTNVEGREPQGDPWPVEGAEGDAVEGDAVEGDPAEGESAPTGGESAAAEPAAVEEPPPAPAPAPAPAAPAPAPAPAAPTPVAPAPVAPTQPTP